MTLRRESERYVTRCAYPNNGRPFWWVRIGDRPVVVEKRFRDSEYGGKRAALKAAKRYRDRAIRRMGGVLPKIAHRRPNPGKKGEPLPVGLTWGYTVRNKKRYKAVRVQWQWDSRRQAVRSFSTRLYGVQGAIRLALKARRDGIKERVAMERLRRRRLKS